MNDTISRQAAIDALIRKMKPHDNGDGTMTIYIMSEELVRETLNDLPSAQPEPKWIPCSERLPDYDGCRTLTTINTHVRSGHYYKGVFYNDNGDTWKATDKEVLAWMPLPGGYSGE